MEKAKPKKRGRKKGSKPIAREQVVVIPSSCPKCGSTDREQYEGHPVVREFAGVKNGFEYNRISWKRTKCRNCGQHRTDQIYEKV